MTLSKLTVSSPDALQSLIIDGIPPGATLSDGTNSFLAGPGAGSVDVTGWDLANLSVTVQSAAYFNLTAVATAQDTTGVPASASATEAVAVAPQAATLDATTSAGLLIPTYNDGSANAPAGTPQMAGLLSGYVVRPPWKVAGVDYAVGVPAGTVLADPTTISIPGVELNTASHIIVISASNVTLSGYDFSTDGGWGIVIAPGVTDTVIKNSNFLVGGDQNVPINALGGMGNLTVLNDTFDGGGGTSDNIWTMVGYSGDGVATFEYNSFLNTTEDAIEFGSGTMTTIVQYNTYQHLGTSPGAHADAVQISTVRLRTTRSSPSIL